MANSHLFVLSGLGKPNGYSSPEAVAEGAEQTWLLNAQTRGALESAASDNGHQVVNQAQLGAVIPDRELSKLISQLPAGYFSPRELHALKYVINPSWENISKPGCASALWPQMSLRTCSAFSRNFPRHSLTGYLKQMLLSNIKGR